MAQVADVALKNCGAFLYDCEIFKLVPSEDVANDPQFQYCKGWNDFSGMGISVAVGYDFLVGEYKIFMADNFHELRQVIESRDVVISFNGHHFDDELILANGIDLPKRKSYDLWKEIVNTQPPGNRFGFALDEMLKGNGIPLKTSSGAEAPKMAQRGEWARLINYCLGDVAKTVMILRLACNGMMKNPKTGGYLNIRKPWEVIQVEPGGALF